jgi:uracil-DNA glycosylase family 4
MNLPQFKAIPDCTKCELHTEAINPGVPTIHYKESAFPSPETPYMIVVGMNPGLNEDKKNEPFVGPTGQMLKNIYLSSLDILKTHTVYFTNAARCCTPGDTQLRNSHIKSCWPYTEEDLETITDFHTGQGSILCLGSHALNAVSKWVLPTKSLTLREGIEKQGMAFTYNNKELFFFCTYHPAGVMRSPNLKYAVSEHLELIGQQLHGHVPSPSLPDIQPPRSPRKEKSNDGNEQGSDSSQSGCLFR